MLVICILTQLYFSKTDHTDSPVSFLARDKWNQYMGRLLHTLKQSSFVAFSCWYHLWNAVQVNLKVFFRSSLFFFFSKNCNFIIEFKPLLSSNGVNKHLLLLFLFLSFLIPARFIWQNKPFRSKHAIQISPSVVGVPQPLLSCDCSILSRGSAMSGKPLRPREIIFTLCYEHGPMQSRDLGMKQCLLPLHLSPSLFVFSPVF